MSPEECPHDSLSVNATVNKLEDVSTISLEVSGSCSGCGAQLSFIGINGGLSLSEPRCSPLGLEARLPAKLFHKDAPTGQYDVEGFHGR